ncbi:GNAT superfamily N-acetyltransferase [Sphingomonas sp. UYAg733]
MKQHDHGEQSSTALLSIRQCGEADAPDILRIINAAAIAYRGVIPTDRWHHPYMPAEELRAEMAAGVRFTGYGSGGTLVGVMGIQQARNVRLIRHAYVLPEWQGHGVGSKLIDHLRGADNHPILIGTWAAADWAIRFYRRHGFQPVPHDAIAPLLAAYWNVPERQIETSVVLAFPALSVSEAARLIAKARPADMNGDQLP